MKTLKHIFEFLALLTTMLAVMTAFAYEGGAIKDFWTALLLLIVLALATALSILCVKFTDDAMEITEGRRELRKDLKENAPRSANHKGQRKLFK